MDKNESYEWFPAIRKYVRYCSRKAGFDDVLKVDKFGVRSSRIIKNNIPITAASPFQAEWWWRSLALHAPSHWQRKKSNKLSATNNDVHRSPSWRSIANQCLCKKYSLTIGGPVYIFQYSRYMYVYQLRAGTASTLGMHWVPPFLLSSRLYSYVFDFQKLHIILKLIVESGPNSTVIIYR